ncbi:MAG: endonuclease V, partial [Candidatus Eisenbacteria bacterium]|nr:endonuclease V [Candidatus Eisenbacteria bacterium]
MRIRTIHAWNLPPRQAAALQRRLAARVVRRGGPLRPRLVAGADIACDRESDRLY